MGKVLFLTIAGALQTLSFGEVLINNKAMYKMNKK